MFDDFQPAVASAKQHAQGLAEQRARDVGGTNLETTLTTEETNAPLASGWGKTVFMELKVLAVAIGKPC